MKLDFKKAALLPAIIQDADTLQVRMTAFMDKEALALTEKTGFVHFFSRSKDRIWKKGEESGNVLQVVKLYADCDRDAILVMARPHGPTCHTGSDSCFGDAPKSELGALMQTIEQRRRAKRSESYTAEVLARGTPYAARKVGEEAVETVVAAMSEKDSEFLGEAADLLYHALLLLATRGKALSDVEKVLAQRSKTKLQRRFKG